MHLILTLLALFLVCCFTTLKIGDQIVDCAVPIRPPSLALALLPQWSLIPYNTLGQLVPNPINR